ncbi:hypothetical protein ACS0TW_41725, partial [Klebsiella michiganensis]
PAAAGFFVSEPFILHKIIRHASRRQVNESPAAYRQYETGVNERSQHRGIPKDDVEMTDASFTCHLVDR